MFNLSNNSIPFKRALNQPFDEKLQGVQSFWLITKRRLKRFFWSACKVVGQLGVSGEQRQPIIVAVFSWHFVVVAQVDILMPSRTAPVHVATTVRKYKGKVCETHLLCRAYRE